MRLDLSRWVEGGVEVALEDFLDVVVGLAVSYDEYSRGFDVCVCGYVSCHGCC